MKWIGEHIRDFIYRFRSAVYLDGIEAGTPASGGTLHVDSNNKIVKRAITSLTDAGVDGSANQLLTDDGDGTVTSESGLTYDGSTLTGVSDNTNPTLKILGSGPNFIRFIDGTDGSVTTNMHLLSYTLDTSSNHGDLSAGVVCASGTASATATTINT